MKGSAESRDLVRADIQFPNEILIYKKVIPTYLSKFKDHFKSIDPKLWCARAYFAETGEFPKLSDQKIETILAVEDLSVFGYQMAPSRVDLSEPEVMLMTKALAQWHSCTYALRIQQDPILDELISDIIPLKFVREESVSLYDILYKIALERLFVYLDKAPHELDSPKLKEDMDVLRKKYLNQPLKLMERFRQQHPTFSVILHGDYNRNNVMFKYDQKTMNPIDLRMFDFQELRYGSPCLDICFYLYMNTRPEQWKTGIFDRVIKYYHETVIASTAELLNCSSSDSRLKPYNFNDFKKHFDQFAFYGGMVALHFLPWMTCPIEECDTLSKLWYADMYSTEFKDLAMICGGLETDKRLAEVVRMASNQGHLEMLRED